ncbi:hypothetical protein QUB05_16855 [Microcoleus sp. F10-C6]|uniref:hypothetical protein n=1 Tax=unclassified Microcoleus TaxID=2642155 RepID=UPI002FD2DAFB
MPSYCDILIVAADRAQNLFDKILSRLEAATLKKTGNVCQPDRRIDSPDFTHAALAARPLRQNYLSIRLR